MILANVCFFLIEKQKVKHEDFNKEKCKKRYFFQHYTFKMLMKFI